MRKGGDGYKVFADNAQNAYDYGPGLEQVVADYLTANRPYTPKLDGRITEIAAADGRSACRHCLSRLRRQPPDSTGRRSPQSRHRRTANRAG